MYDRVLRHRKMTMDKFNTLRNINLNMPARSMRGILMYVENVAAQQPFARNTEAFYNPQITKVAVTIDGIPNQLYSQGMRAYQMWDEEKSNVVTRFLATQFLFIVYKSAVVYFMLFAINTGLFFNMQIFHLSRS